MKRIENPAGIRIVELPACSMITSKGRDLDDFDEYWTALDRRRTDRFHPRDFMYFDPVDKELVWLYACPDGPADDGGFARVDFPGGLYAACISRDQDDVDGERVQALVEKWIEDGGAFRVDQERHGLFHVITPDRAFERMGYRQLDIYVPIS